MKKITLWFRAVFGFNQSEINGFIILSILMVLLLIAPFLYSYLSKPLPYDSTNDELALEELLVKASTYKKEKQKEYDKKKIYTKNKKKWYKEKPHHIIKSENGQIDDSKPKWIPNKFKKEIIPFEINSADTTALKQIKGIGSKLSERIIKHRNNLGGFHSLKQLKEVYGLDSNLITKNSKYFLELNVSQIIKLNLDTSGVKTLIRHPYLNYKKAIAIVNYRAQHGNYKSIKDLMKIHLLKLEDVEKLRPYLPFE